MINLLDASNILMYLQSVSDHHKIRAVNIEVIYEMGEEELTKSVVSHLSEQGIDSQLVYQEDPEALSDEFPSVCISGW